MGTEVDGEDVEQMTDNFYKKNLVFMGAAGLKTNCDKTFASL